MRLERVKLSICLGWELREDEEEEEEEKGGWGEKKKKKRSWVTQLTLLPGQRLMNDYFSLPAGFARSPVARRVKETQFRQDKSQGDNLL